VADEFDLWRVIGILAGADDHLIDQRAGRLQDLRRVAALDGLAQHGDPPGIEFGEIGVQGGRGGRFLLEGGEQLALPCLQLFQLALHPGRADPFGDGVDEVLELPLHCLKLPPASLSGGGGFAWNLFHSSMNARLKAATCSGRISRVPSASITMASSLGRLTRRVLEQPRPLRIAAQAR
jgi:hypothetical protein